MLMDLYEAIKHFRTLTEAASKIDRNVENLYCFDMDDTLIAEPQQEIGKEEYEKLTGKKWPFKRW